MADQLWSKDAPLDRLVHEFTVGEDPQTDLALMEWDCIGSAAHARMLASINLIPREAASTLVAELKTLRDEAARGELIIRPEQEDGHTAIEALLTKRVGEPGRMIHLGRSRNDQIALATRLWMRSRVLTIAEAVADLVDAFLAFAAANIDITIPGYTHLRRAMPSSAGQWAAAFAEGLMEELDALAGLWARLDRCPLGSAAGFGVPIPLDRDETAALLGFTHVQISPIDVQNSRGRHEAAMMHWLASIAGVLEKFCWDCLLYSTEEFGFLRIPEAFTTGSSIMPQKRNPDVLELARGRCREIRGYAALMDHLGTGSPSSYHRDFQLVKRPAMESAHQTERLVRVLTYVIPGLVLDRARAAAACTDELWATQAAFDLTKEGIPFRDAYRQVAAEVTSGEFQRPTSEPEGSLGAPDNLRLDRILQRFDNQRMWLDDQSDAWEQVELRLWEPLH